MFELKLNDIILTKKNHPCGNNEFQILRTGADYKIKCTKCGKIILIDDTTLQKRIKKINSGYDNI